VLKAIADVIADQCHGHMVARYGGEEFVVLFAGIDLQSAREKLENARTKVARKRYRLRESDTALGEVTFSAGLTAARLDEGVADVFVRADQLLYAAKADGRNCLKAG
jgi:diguanylate cyclase